MTISEQLREVALDARYPWSDMNSHQFIACCDYKRWDQSMMDLSGTDLRTFMLLVAEALE